MIDDTADDPGNPVQLLFPEVHDLCASKLVVAVTGGFGRRSDRASVKALVDAGHVDIDVLTERIGVLPVHEQVRAAALGIVARLS